MHSLASLRFVVGHRPLWICPDGRICLESFSPVYKAAYDFLIAVAEPVRSGRSPSSACSPPQLSLAAADPPGSSRRRTNPTRSPQLRPRAAAIPRRQVCRPESMHEYALTPHSLYAAVSVGLETETILSVLNRLSKTYMPPEIEEFVRASTQNYGKVKIVLQKNRFFLESPYPEVLRALLEDDVIAEARAYGEDDTVDRRASAFTVAKAPVEEAAVSLAAEAAKCGAARRCPSPCCGERTRPVLPLLLTGACWLSELRRLRPPGAAQGRGRRRRRPRGRPGPGAPLVRDHPRDGAPPKPRSTAFDRFPRRPTYYRPSAPPALRAPRRPDAAPQHSCPPQVEKVRQRCMPPDKLNPSGLNYPTLEEYDFRNDTANPDLPFELKPGTHVRPYQEKSLAKMFGNGRARSGIIVLPCGAGKSLTGIAAAVRVRKSCLCLCTSSVSVDQWCAQFKLWTTIPDSQIVRFTSQNKECLPDGVPGVVVSTYNMIAFKGHRSEESERILAAIRGREWGLMLLDEVHVVPAAMFRKVVGITKAHCKLGLTATLVREDERIDHLNFLIGPKLYEANWLDLQRNGFIANVQCAEVWCPMTREFYAEYLKKENLGRRQALYCMNPTKFQTCQYLMQYHEQERGDKIIVFSDNIFALREYATRLRRPFIYGGTGHQERTRVLYAFKHSTEVNTIFLSKVGDNSIDIPEANVIIQISSHAARICGGRPLSLSPSSLLRLPLL